LKASRHRLASTKENLRRFRDQFDGQSSWKGSQIIWLSACVLDVKESNGYVVFKGGQA
jgi:hypothetical protein